MKYLFLLFGIVLGWECFSQEARPRIIVMTDGEVDDQSSMIRFLLYANEFDIEAIIETNSVYQRNGHSVEPWLETQLDAYEKDYPNLIMHSQSYPSAAELRALCYVGDEDSSHIVVDNQSQMRGPGMKPRIDPSKWSDTPGSDKIVEVLLDFKPGPVFIQAWGGGNTAAKAFEKLKRVYPDQYERAVKKAIMYNIWYQDGAGSYIEQFHPEVTMLISYHFNGTWDYGSQNNSTAFVTENLANGKGYLGKLYPQTYISEGDSPSFFYTIPNGLRSFEDPTFGGWGGLFYKVDGFKNVYRDANKGSYTRWVEQVNSDYQARLKWCETDDFSKANHAPIVNIKGEQNITIKSGQTLTLEGEFSDPDPLDIDELWRKYGSIYQQHGGTRQTFEAMAKNNFPKTKAHWWQFEEAGTYKGFVPLIQTEKSTLTFIAPQVSKPSSIHMVLEVSDTGQPKLTSYKRLIINVIP